LLRWLQAQREGGASADETTQLRLESDRNLVQIVTVHKSKGLEYPVVFCPFLWDGRLRPAGDGLEGAARHDDDGAAVIDFRGGIDPAFDEVAARAEARMEAAAEFMRLVYVALTRAMQRCYLVVGSYRNKAGKHWSKRESAGSGLNWLVASGGLSPQAWLAPKRPLATPAAIDAAWAALATPAVHDALPTPAAGTPAAIAVTPLPAAWLRPLPASSTGGGTPQALAPPADLGRAWWIGSYSALVHGVAGSAAGPVAAAAAAALTVPSTAEERAAAGRGAADHDLRTEPGEAAPWPIDRAPFDATEWSPQQPAPQPSPWSAQQAPPLAADDILGFPRGAVAGECVHAALEWAEFTDPASWPEAAARALLMHPPSSSSSSSASGPVLAPGATATAQAPLQRGPADVLQAQLQRLLADVLQTPLPLGTLRPLRLAELPPGRRLAELEFHLPVPQLAATDLVALLARLGYGAPALDFRALHGYLKGFIDLVFEHDGRYFIADWKSNHLGHTPADYGAAPMAAAMAQHHYHLQYLLYSVALHRWLGRRLPDYHYDRHVGGVAYLFVRGLRPHWRDAQGQPTGLFFHRPSAEAITQLSALLGGERAAP
jgi:exodeoxyribonuclease V beta subunit